MDTDTLITYFLLFLFFVVPSILKRRKKKAVQKKKTTEIQTQKTGFGGLGDAIRGFIKELEKQAQEARNAEKQGAKTSDSSIWEMLDDREEEAPMAEASVSMTGDQPRAPDSLSPDGGRPAPAVEKNAHTDPWVKTRSKAGKPAKPEVSEPRSPRVRAALPASALQQAVVWSEILGPPKALRQD